MCKFAYDMAFYIVTWPILALLYLGGESYEWRELVRGPFLEEFSPAMKYLFGNDK